MTDFIQHRRLKIRVSVYEDKHYGAITDLLGTNIVIKAVNRLPIVQDGNYIFDVDYMSLSLNPLQYYIINTADLKPISEYSTNYYIRINNIPVKINVNIQEDVLKQRSKIMVQINKILTTDHINHDYFKYYGIIVKNPLHDYISVLGQKYGYKLNCEVKEWKDEEVKIFSNADIELSHKMMLSNSMYGKQYSVFKEVQNQSEIVSKSIAYKISAFNLVDFPIYGVVFVVEKRKHIYDVVVGINNNFSFTYEQWLTLMNFLDYERYNYNQYLSTLA